MAKLQSKKDIAAIVEYFQVSVSGSSDKKSLCFTEFDGLLSDDWRLSSAQLTFSWNELRKGSLFRTLDKLSKSILLHWSLKLGST